MLPRPRSGFATCIVNENLIFVVGGNDSSVLDKVDVFDLDKKKWNIYPSLWVKWDELAMTIGPDGKIYAVGGYGGS